MHRTPLAALLRHRHFRHYTLGSLVSLIGAWAQRLALGWLVWETTGSAAWVGLLAVADAAPIAVLGVVGGAMADRTTALVLARRTVAVSVGCTAGMWFAVAAATPSLSWVLALALLNGVATALGQPSRMVLAPSLVPRADVPAAVALGSVSFNVARLVGPLLGGALLAELGPAAAVGFNALSYAAFLTVLWRLPAPSPSPAPRPTPPGDPSVAPAGSVAGAGAGLAQVLSEPAVLWALAATFILSVGVRSYAELLPGVAGALLGRGPSALALLSGSAGLGAILGGLWTMSTPAEARLHGRMVASGALAALVLLGLAGVGELAVALGLASSCGALLLVSATSAQAIVQLEAPSGCRGRSMGLFLVALRGGPALGALGLGSLADRVGLRSGLAVGGLLALVALGALVLGHRYLTGPAGGGARARSARIERPKS